MPKFQMNVVVDPTPNVTARVSDSTTGVTASFLTKVDAGKFVKLAAESRYGMCAVGDEIEGLLATADDVANLDGFAMGSVQQRGRIKVMLDGLQGTPGTGEIAIGDYVVAGTVTARGTALPSSPKVCKATALTFATTPAVNFPAGGHLNFKWRLVAILVGTTAVGSIGVIERVN